MSIKRTKARSSPSSTNESSAAIGPSLPPGFYDDNSSKDPPRSTVPYGPCLPSTCSTSTRLSPQPDIDRSDSVRCDIHGPALPPGYSSADHGEPSSTIRTRPRDEHVTVGPSLPPDYDEESETDVIGPLPLAPGSKDEESRGAIRREIESRCKTMKDKLTGMDGKADQKPQREDWMLVLPKEFKPSGIGPRKFRTGAIDSGDRSVWTDTPADKLKKQQEANEGKSSKTSKTLEDFPNQSSRDQKLEKYVNEHNKSHRPESLMSLHRKRRAEELKEQGGVKERKPFNRETDLEIRSTVTPAKRKALMKDSKQSLDSKFTHGSQSFL